MSVRRAGRDVKSQTLHRKVFYAFLRMSFNAKLTLTNPFAVYLSGKCFISSSSPVRLWHSFQTLNSMQQLLLLSGKINISVSLTLERQLQSAVNSATFSFAFSQFCGDIFVGGSLPFLQNLFCLLELTPRVWSLCKSYLNSKEAGSVNILPTVLNVCPQFSFCEHICVYEFQICRDLLP